jgi:pilus assembly protein FimV
MLRVLARLCVVACALWASQALALGLGDINVKSKLNQPFSASIAVLGASSVQIDSLSVKLASADDFNRAGIERSDYLSTLKFDIQEAAGGARVVISSDQIAREPFLNFIVEANSPEGKLLREYTVLLDPPVSADSAAPATTYTPPAASYTPPAAPVVQVPASSAPSMPAAEAASLASQGPAAHLKHGKTRPAKPAPPVAAASSPPAAVEAPAAAPVAAAPAETGGSSYGPIAPQETFWSIATKLRPGPQVSMDQVLLAIYRANPQAFDRGNFNGLLKGHTLQVPSLAQMQEASAPEAKSAVDAWRHGTRPAGVKKNPEATEPAVAPAPAKVEKARPLKAKPAKPAAAVQAVAPAPAPVAPPVPETKPEPAVAPAPAPAPAASAPAATPAAEPAKPQAADNAAPAAQTPASTSPAASTPPPAPTQPAPDQVKKTVPPPPESSLFDDPMTLLGAGLFIVVIVAFALFIFRRRKTTTPDFTAKAPLAKLPKLPLTSAKAPKAPAPPPIPPPSKAAPSPPLPPKAPPPKPAEPPPIPKAAPAAPALDQTFTGREAPLARTALEDTAQIKLADTALAEPVFDHTAKTKPVGSGDLDFDLTSQFEAQTLSVNLDANDPLSEADFHLAYGLYDEAASLLKQALVKEPQRQDLRLKLAETYFAGGKPMEFQETTEALHSQISPTEWQKIAIMGRQLCPDSSLFKSDGNAPAPDIDLSLGDSIGPAPLQVLGTTSSRPAATQGNVIDFDLESELNKSLPSTPAPRPAAPVAAPAPAESADFDLSHFDLGAEPHSAHGEGLVEFNLDELDLSKPAAGGHGVSSGDEIGTKLDLARVYADMGDNDAARGLLHEVLNTGNATQKGEAEALIKRLSA